MSEETQEAPKATFNTLILSLSTTALLHLGTELEGMPADRAPEVNLSMAQHSIDMLSLLEEKTKGNLTGEEERLLSGILYDLRMRFVSVSKSQS